MHTDYPYTDCLIRLGSKPRPMLINVQAQCTLLEMSLKHCL